MKKLSVRIKHKINYLIPEEWYHLLNIMKLETQRLQPTYSPPQNLKWLISRNSFFHFLLLRKWNSTPDKKNRKFKKNTLLYYMLYQVPHQSCETLIKIYNIHLFPSLCPSWFLESWSKWVCSNGSTDANKNFVSGNLIIRGLGVHSFPYSAIQRSA